MPADEKIVLRASQSYSPGTEIEFQIVDQNSYSLVALGPKLHDLAPKILHSRILQELIKSILKIQAGICRSLRDVLLLARATRYGQKLDSRSSLREVSSIVSEGSGADQQRLIYQKTGDLRDVLGISYQGFWK
jgi:gamma-glutamyl:cysteine ligase YbdK (ATP-grasp superfamily)